MKIIKSGNSSQQPKPPFWVGQTLACPKCGCKFKLEARDKPVPKFGDARIENFYCPTPHCGTLVEVKPQ